MVIIKLILDKRIIMSKTVLNYIQKLYELEENLN